MKLTFTYQEERDVWCLLNYGRSSMNSSNPTQRYEELVKSFGESPTEQDAGTFVKEYINNHNIDISKRINQYADDWEKVENLFIVRAKEMFNVQLTEDITVYLTLNNRCPYSIEKNYFFARLAPVDSVRRTAMHELWHFYTWYRFGIAEEQRLGKQKYNDLKEALTTLLNIEFPEHFSEYPDMGYPQHKELRERVLSLWQEYKDIQIVWQKAVESI